MSYRATVYKVLIASPSDVTSERSIVRQVLAEWNAVHSQEKSIALMPIGWETHAAPATGAAAQTIVNKQILADADLLVGIFWTKIGTPTENYVSGSVEEVEEHIKTGKPAMLYFCSAPVRLDSVDEKQYSALKDFRESCKSRSLYETYSDYTEFKDKFYRQLQITVHTDGYFAAGRSESAENSDPKPSASPKPPTLSKEAKLLLKEAVQSADGTIVRIMTFGGLLVQANRKEFCGNRDPKQQALWEGALEELERLGFIKDRGYKKEVFRVTREGYEAAEIIAV